MKLNDTTFKWKLIAFAGLTTIPTLVHRPAVATSEATTTPINTVVSQAVPSQGVTSITAVRINSRTEALEIELETAEGQLLQVDSAALQSQGNSLTLEIPNAVLSLPDGNSYAIAKPASDIRQIQLEQITADRVRLTVTGDTLLPKTAIVLKSAERSYPLKPSSPATIAEEVEEEITVTGTRSARLVRLTPGSISVIDDQEIDRGQVRDLRDLVQYEPNVSVGNNRRYGLQDINIRGLGGNRVLIQNDGIRIPTQFTFGTPSIGRDYVELETLQRAEIIRGPASALYGSDALGGVVSFKSIDPSDLLNRYDRQNSVIILSSGVETSDRSWINTATAALRGGNFEGLLSYTRRDGNESRLPNDNEFVDSRDSERNNWLGKIIYRPNDTNKLTLTTERFRDNSNFEVAPLIANNLLGPAGFRGNNETLENKISRDRISLSYNFDDPDSKGFLSAGRAQIYYQNAEVDETRNQDFSRTGTGNDRRRIRNLENNFLDQTIGGDIQLQSTFNIGNVANKLTYGFEISRTRNERTRDGIEDRFNATGSRILTTNVIGADNFPVKDFPDSETSRLGLYVQNEIDFGDHFTLIPGLRFDSYSLKTKSDRLYERNVGAVAASLESTSLSPSLGFVWKATPELSLVGRYARGFRAPLYSEINSGFTNLTSPFFRYKTLSNPDLEPETSDTFELGLRGSYRQFSFSANAFYNRYDNFIQAFAAAGTSTTIVPGAIVNLFQSQNIAKAQTYGFELGGSYRFTPEPHGLSILAALGLTVGDNLTTNQPLESIDPFKAVVGIRYRAPKDRWGTDLTATITARPRLSSDRPDNAFSPEGSMVFDLTGYYNITPMIAINAGIFNIFNNDYALYSDVRSLVNSPTPTDIGRYSQPGISLRTGLTWRF